MSLMGSGRRADVGELTWRRETSRPTEMLRNHWFMIHVGQEGEGVDKCGSE